MDGLPVTHKVIFGRQTVIQGQGHFTKCGLPQVMPPVVWMGFKELTFFTESVI